MVLQPWINTLINTLTNANVELLFIFLKVMAIKFPGIQLQLQTYKSQSTDKTFCYMIKKNTVPFLI